MTKERMVELDSTLRSVAVGFTSARIGGLADDELLRLLAINLRDIATEIDRLRGITEEPTR